MFSSSWSATIHSLFLNQINIVKDSCGLKPINLTQQENKMTPFRTVKETLDEADINHAIRTVCSETNTIKR